MKPPKNKKWSDILTIKDLISVLSELPSDYYVITAEEGVVHNLIWGNIDINDEEETIFLG